MVFDLKSKNPKRSFFFGHVYLRNKYCASQKQRGITGPKSNGLRKTWWDSETSANLLSFGAYLESVALFVLKWQAKEKYY